MKTKHTKIKTLYTILLVSTTSVISANASLIMDIKEGPTDTQLVYTLTGSHTWATNQDRSNVLFDLKVDFNIYDSGLNISSDLTLTNSNLMMSINGAPGILFTKIHIDDDGGTALDSDDFILMTASNTSISTGDTVVFSGSGTVDTGVSNALSQVNAGSFTVPDGGGIDITVTKTVPEPSSSLLAGLGLTFVACRRKR